LDRRRAGSGQSGGVPVGWGLCGLPVAVGQARSSLLATRAFLADFIKLARGRAVFEEFPFYSAFRLESLLRKAALRWFKGVD
jgi:hypothetical protein